MIITRPTYSNTTVADALAANWRGWHLSQKMDGIFAVREFAGCVVTGEALRDGSFHPFDISTAFGSDVRCQTWKDRNEALRELLASVTPEMNWHSIASGVGAGFVETILARGGEGIVAKRWDSFFGFGWFKVKRQETFDCVVTDTSSGKLSVAIAFNGQPAGRVSIRSLPTLDSLNPGDWIEISAMNQHQSGKFREPRFVRTRPDKGGKTE